MQVGKKNDDWKNDVEGKPQSKASKAIRSAVQLVTKIAKKAASESGALSEDQLAAVEAAADAVNNQAEADPNTSLKDRLKMGGKRRQPTIKVSLIFSLTAKDGAGVAGHGLNAASEYVPNEYSQG